MRAVTITRHGGPKVLTVREVPDPSPRPGEVRIRVRAAGLNFADVMARQGLYPDAPPPPCAVGYEVSGVVETWGDGVAGAPPPGARVVALCRFGGHSDVVCVAAEQVRPMPDSMSFEQGAALPVVYLTAHHMLFRVAGLRPGARVLVHMAAGGVGTAVIDLCRTVPGVETFGTASASKHAFLRERGCDHPIDYHAVDYAREVRRRTGGRGVDIVLDPLGGRDTRKGYRLLRPAGMLVAYGFANMAAGSRRKLGHILKSYLEMPRFSPLSMMNDNRAVAGVNIGHLWKATEILAPQLDRLLELFREGKVRPVVDSTFPFERAAEAHARIEQHQNVGKVLLVPS